MKEDDILVSYLSCACTEGMSVGTLVDVKGRPCTCLPNPEEEDPPHPFHPSLPSPWAQLWPGKGGGHKGERPCLSFFSLCPYRPYIPNTRKLKKTVTPTRETVAGAVKNWR